VADLDPAVREIVDAGLLARQGAGDVDRLDMNSTPS